MRAPWAVCVQHRPCHTATFPWSEREEPHAAPAPSHIWGPTQGSLPLLVKQGLRTEVLFHPLLGPVRSLDSTEWRCGPTAWPTAGLQSPTPAPPSPGPGGDQVPWASCTSFSSLQAPAGCWLLSTSLEGPGHQPSLGVLDRTLRVSCAPEQRHAHVAWDHRTHDRESITPQASSRPSPGVYCPELCVTEDPFSKGSFHTWKFQGGRPPQGGCCVEFKFPPFPLSSPSFSPHSCGIKGI